MRSLKLDDNNNLVFKNDFSLIEDKEAIIQDVKTLLLMFKSEYPFDIDVGIDWYGIAAFNDISFIKTQVKSRILEDKRIKSVDSIDISFKNGKLEISADLNTEIGVVNV